MKRGWVAGLWTLGVLILIGMWLVYVPRRLDRLFDAIPADARVVARMDRLYQRWDRMAACPLLRPALSDLGLLTPDGTNGWTTPPAVRMWMRRLASDRVVFAYVPHGGAQRKPAWIGAAWTGGRTRWLHWMMRLGVVDGVREDRSDPVHRFWVANLGRGAEGPFLTFGFQEGITVACLSPDPGAVGSLLVQMDHRRPGGQAARFPCPPMDATAAPAPSDWAWILKPGAPMTAEDRYAPVALTQLDAEGIRGVGWLGSMAPPPAGWSDESDWAPGLSQTPVIWFKMPHTFWPTLTRTFAVSGPLRLAGDALLPEAGGEPRPVYGGLLNAACEMRIKGPFRDVPLLSNTGLKIPTGVLALPMPDGEGVAMGRLMGLLDQLNSRYGWGLIPHPIAFQGRRVTLIEGSRPNLYGRFELDERVVLAPMEKTLLIGSSAGGLRRAFQRAPSNETACAWNALRGDTVWGGVWIDGVEAWPVVRGLLGAAMLAQTAGGAPPANRAALSEGLRWAESLRRVEHAAIRIEPGPDGRLRAVLEAVFKSADE